MKIINFLICEDIRHEDGGKKSFMGVYDETIEFLVNPESKNTWPKVGKIGVVAKIIFDDSDIVQNISSFKVNYSCDGDVTKIGESPLNKDDIAKKQKISMALMVPNFAFTKMGEMKFIFEFYNDKGAMVGQTSPHFSTTVKERVIE